jgi:hypothetical protein
MYYSNYNYLNSLSIIDCNVIKNIPRENILPPPPPSQKKILYASLTVWSMAVLGCLRVLYILEYNFGCAFLLHSFAAVLRVQPPMVFVRSNGKTRCVWIRKMIIRNQTNFILNISEENFKKCRIISHSSASSYRKKDFRSLYTVCIHYSALHIIFIEATGVIIFHLVMKK